VCGDIAVMQGLMHKTKSLVCCSVLQCAVVCCSVLPCVAVCCCALQCGAVCGDIEVMQGLMHKTKSLQQQIKELWQQIGQSSNENLATRQVHIMKSHLAITFTIYVKKKKYIEFAFENFGDALGYT